MPLNRPDLVHIVKRTKNQTRTTIFIIATWLDDISDKPYESAGAENSIVGEVVGPADIIGIHHLVTRTRNAALGRDLK